MIAATILCYAVLLLFPSLTLYCALHFRKISNQPGAQLAYPMEHAPATPDAWTYVQNLAASRLIVSAILAFILGIGFMLILPIADTISLLCCAGIALGLEVFVLLVGMTIIGMAIQSHFKSAAL